MNRKEFDTFNPPIPGIKRLYGIRTQKEVACCFCHEKIKNREFMYVEITNKDVDQIYHPNCWRKHAYGYEEGQT